MALPWKTLALALVAVSFLAASSGCGEEHHASPPENSRLEVQRRPDGRVDLVERDGRLILRGAWAEVLVDSGGSRLELSSRGCVSGWQPDPAVSSPSSYFAASDVWRWRCEQDGLTLDWSVGHDRTHDTLITQLRLENHSGIEVRALRLTPLISEGVDGGLFVGDHPSGLRILDDGSNIAGEVDAKLHYAGEPRNPLLDLLLPIASRGDVLSNWNHAVVDLDTQRSWIAGALTVERAYPTLGTRLPAVPPQLGESQGLEVVADNALLFRGKPLADGEAIDSETMYFDPLAPDPFTGLEDYADAIAAWQAITPWTRRDGGRAVPNGWNSWTGSRFSGGLGTDINEQIIHENLDVMAREFAPFGVDYFQVDDGYQVARGDWQPRPDRFPSGMAALSRRVKDEGLIPGLWISAFSVDESSALFAQHPEWMARPRDNALGPLLAPNPGTRVLDLHNSEAVAWVGDTLRRYKEDWGLGWIKLDFAYLALPYSPAESRLTSIEAYKRGIRAVRSAIGDEVFYLGIALMGVNWGVVDGMRLTLDTAPRWEEEDPFALLAANNSFKSTVRTGARRYYFHDRVWINHNDLLFFRTDIGHPDPPVTTEEAITLASFIGMSGSIVKFGEDLRTLTPEQIQIWRKLLPTYPATARPLDLFTRMYPEQWSLPIDGTLAASNASWHVLGLLNWGRNFDYTNDGTASELADAARTYDVELASLGLLSTETYLAQEFWSETFLGEVQGTLRYTVPAHGHAVIALRANAGHPQLVGSNRHFTQGATDLVEERWDRGDKTLTLTFDVDQGRADAKSFEYRWRVFVPAGFELVDAEVGSATVSRNDRIVTIALTPASPQRVTLRLIFSSEICRATSGRQVDQRRRAADRIELTGSMR